MIRTIARRSRSAAVVLADAVPRAPGNLAEPPSGSPLTPVVGDPGLPVLGHALSLLQDPVAFALRRYEKYGAVSWARVLDTDLVMVVGPDALGEVFSNRERAFANGPGWEYFIGPFFKRGVMLLDFEEHVHHRRIMQEAFTRDRLVDYLDLLNATIVRALAGWADADGFLAFAAIQEMLLDAATEVFVGEELGEEAGRLHKAFVDTVVAGRSLVRADVPGGGWHRGLVGRRVLEDYFRDLIPSKRGSEGRDLFSVLCRSETKDGERFTDEDIVNHMIFVLMAAHDTSTITATTLVHHLGKDAVWQQRLRDEVGQVPNSSPTFDDLGNLPLLDQAFREALRINAPVGMVVRQAVKDTSVLGHHVPEGTKVVVHVAASQLIDDFWADPDVFDPDRFSKERDEAASHRYAWTPFGAGAHKCIGMFFGGMEVKAILFHVLREFSWTVDPGYRMPIEYGTGRQPADGLPIRLHRR